MIGLCTDCTKRQYCNTLCPEAELYANQDWVHQKELTAGFPEFSQTWPDGAEPHKLTKRETQVLFLLLDGKSKQDIALILKISRSTIRDYLSSLRKKLKNLILD